MATRDELVTEIRSLADAAGSNRWSNTTVLKLLDTVFQQEWGDILNIQPAYRAAERSVVLDSQGRIALSDLSAADQTLYRIIGVRVGDRLYAPGSLRENLLTRTLNYPSESNHRLYWLQGDYLYLWPFSASDTATVMVNHLPTLPSLLANGNTAVTFPSPFEMILAFETAGLMLAKGGAETDATGDMKALADGMRNRLLSDLQRRSADPVAWTYSDSRAEWAG